ncbi:MAG: methylglyoxal synthase [Oscillospiraceae bacterium]|jgi:methylglyoxal synthase|nr:methylglyoxal synthase [Oscillospiraceae bacterium]
MPDFIILTIPVKKKIALIAHDNKKQDLVDWCARNQEILIRHELCGTGTTAMLITGMTGMTVKGYNSGPLGGDQQIGAKIVEGKVDLVIFFSDPLTAQPHDPDVKALMRIAQVYDIPIATNRATADFLITSPLMNATYDRKVVNFRRAVSRRSQEMANMADREPAEKRN